MTWTTIALVAGFALITVAMTTAAAVMVASYIAHRVALVTTARILQAALDNPPSEPTDSPTAPPSRRIH
jgi:hypothetical protein